MAAGLDGVPVIDALATRLSRAPDFKAEADAIAALACAMTEQPGNVLRRLAETIVAMNIGGSAGLCVLDETGDHVRWQAVAGFWSNRIDTVLSLDQAPCGIVIERDAALLFHDPKRWFPALEFEPGIREILSVPIHLAGKPVGTVWAVSHDGDRRFEREDARLLGRLAVFVSAAHRLERALDDAEKSGAAVRAELHCSETRFGQVVESVPLLLWRATDTGHWVWASPQWAAFTGQSETASRAQGWLDAVHPDDRRQVRRAWRQARSAEAFEIEHRILHAARQDYRWFRTRVTPIRDDRGAIVEWVGSSTDIDDLKQAREHEQASRSELQHGVRNTLAVVRSIARRTADNSDSVEDFQMHFDGRIGAFARAQSMVTRDMAGGIDLETLIAEELLAHHAHEGEQATIAGPPVRLKPKIADTIGLAIHELVVNAIKFGGLSSDLGRISVGWKIDDTAVGPVLALTWIDGAVDRPVLPPRHRGFGSELIERSLVYELDAETRMRFEPHGLHCDIRLPLTGRLA